ncbi:MAG TPA: S-methyl-5-thioribose-1-phosphate isomerase [Candidatus Krumholzibacteria bacterium]|nr:S-methyl-5-thioribose-1-phosphate isomerase [Candidatus Krumholzibacteria bacterium]
MSTSTVAYRDGAVHLLDQTRLPHHEEVLVCGDVPTLVDAIRRLVVRGAPAIGVAAGHGVVMAAERRLDTGGDFVAGVREDIETLRASRPTAVNLGWALDRQVVVLDRMAAAEPTAVRDALAAEARAIHAEDEELCRRMGRFGAELLPDPATVITHCNTGALATAGIGTALGVILTAAEQGRTVKVFADETRPLLQGARLTAWELRRAGVGVEVMSDGAAGWCLHTQPVDAVLVGSDRIAANGDVANKIGTYPLAVLARRHGVPFYVVAPTSTVDLTLPAGDGIPIEQRDSAEVTAYGGHPVAPEGVGGFNPAFDVTPAELVSAIVTDQGVLRPPYGPALESAVAASRANH